LPKYRRQAFRQWSKIYFWKSPARVKIHAQKPVDDINPITQPEFSVMESSLAFAMDAGQAGPALQLTRPKLVFRTELA
jgi:hypothetical protein